MPRRPFCSSRPKSERASSNFSGRDFDALHPRYPAVDGFVLDLTEHGNETAGSRYEVVAERIVEVAAKIYANGSGLRHAATLSVFGLAPIPLLMVLGNALSNKVRDRLLPVPSQQAEPVDVVRGQLALLSTRCAQQRKARRCQSRSAVLSLSGLIDAATLPPSIDDASPSTRSRYRRYPRYGLFATAHVTWRRSAERTGSFWPS